MKEIKNDFLKNVLFILAFIEGGAVMCVELSSAKILSPYFGTSIYVWASVLGVTLTALMSGYYLGGYISSNYKKKEIVYWMMLIGGVLVTLTPLISSLILPLTIQLDLLSGTVFSLLSFLFIPLMLFGSTSPLIINMITDYSENSGKSSGNVYAVSTFGGIIVTFTIGFYTFPQFGITLTLYAYGILVIISALFLFILTKTFKLSLVLILIIPIVSWSFNTKDKDKGIIYRSEGILGEIKVVDRELTIKGTNQSKVYRELMVNNISQTIMDKEDPNKSYWDYVDIVTKNILSYRQGNNALLLGLGGGTLYKQLRFNQLQVEVVELDKRIAWIAKQYFYIDKDVEVVIDDARHFINTTTKKYDVVIYDLYHSETPPIHLLTKEAFQEISNRLTKEGILTINFYGFISGSKGKAARSIYKTLKDQGFYVKLIVTPGPETSRNLIFICKKNTFQKDISEEGISIDASSMDLNDAVVLTDDKPILEHIYLEAAIMWRRGYNEWNTKYFLN
ncbi:MAG: fused MFS/spermidine synthase [Flavobacteriaceae bacterium]|nr:fused MFS/spermidine synthase [Flavobacteriaceae bacterium]